ncbi:Hypothetical predicted protein [Octopus vulgaris]|uniref:Uncharacterized protein n=1 Tax=Octopus vulgaris TaxID=6645 RepID=A0AA36B9A2_OCTVU|nr:Hypothetical predicted protein [Octopus vulgaris]
MEYDNKSSSEKELLKAISVIDKKEEKMNFAAVAKGHNKEIDVKELGENEAIADHGEGFPPGTSERSLCHNRSHTQCAQNRHKWKKEEYDTLIECHERAKLERSRGLSRHTLKFWMEKDMCSMSENKLMNQVKVIRRNGYLTGVEISRISESLRDPAGGLQRMVEVEIREVGVESREKNRQEEQWNGDGAVKDEERERYTVNPDTVLGGHAGEMNQFDNELLEIQRQLTDLNASEEKNPHEYEMSR